jgi:hypothetical protein
VVGDKALRVWGELVTTATTALEHCEAKVYRPGGDEIGIIVARKKGVGDAEFRGEVLDVGQALAGKEHWAEGDNTEGKPTKMPTFLRCACGDAEPAPATPSLKKAL